MIRSLAPIFSSLWRVAIVLLSVEIVIVSLLRYVIGGAAGPPVILGNAFANPYLALHVVAGATALLLGPLQFVRRIRMRTPGFHRACGRVYVGACIVGAPAGFMLALGTTAGPVAGVGFAIPALLWPLFTCLGWQAAMERRFGAHREWMLRSYALTSTAITLRLMLPLAGALGLEFMPAYVVISWLAWTTNLVLFEIYLRWSRTAGNRTLAAA